MISSMTGFGSAEGLVGGARASVEIRTVNHRFFSPNLKLPSAFARWESEIREVLRQKISRGHVTLTAHLDRGEASAPTIDEGRLTAYVTTLKDLKKKHKLVGEIDLATLLRLPDVIAAPSDEIDPDSGGALVEIVSHAAENLSAMRKAEGAKLAGFLLDRVNAVEEKLAHAEARAPVRLREHHARVKKSVDELLGAAAIDPQRVALEIALLADKLDIAEELDRFRSHLSAFRDTVRSPTGEPVGKRLGFILQEMLREANTIGSKANDAPILDDVIAIKEELERIREQVENLE